MIKKKITDFTSEELRAELKRRSYALKLHNRRLIKPEDRYYYITAEVVDMKRNSVYYKHDYKLKSNDFKTTFNDPKAAAVMTWNVVSGHFNPSTMPRVGDIVRLRYRKSNNTPTMARIFEIVQRHQEVIPDTK